MKGIAMTCIYYKNRDDLTYQNQEHIFPAALHGIKKLPKGYVSTEANNYFSKMENEMIHGSLVFFYRSIFGPTRRKGKKKKDQTKVVQIMKESEDPTKVILGYMEEGTPVLIPQLYLKEPIGELHFPRTDLNEFQKLVEQFLSTLQMDDVQIHLKNSKDIEGHDVIVGFANKVLYFGVNPDYVISDNEKKTIKNKAKKVFQDNKDLLLSKDFHEGNNRVQAYYHLCESIDTYRVFGKIAFNVLAEIKGQDYALDDAFDSFREWVMGKDDPDYSNFIPVVDSSMEFKKLVPYSSHWCVFLNIGGDLCAVVSLYNSIERKIVLAKGRGKDFPMIDGMICDWRNGKEYRLIDYINQICIVSE